jgi:hypothetical protein
MAGVLLAGITTRANPVVATPASEIPANIYMASENLRVTISPTDAVFNASFTFKPDHTPYNKVPVGIWLPIWFPQNSTEDLSVAEFWATFDKEDEAGDVVATAREKRVFDQALRLNISAGNRRLVANYFRPMPATWAQGNPNWINPRFFERAPGPEFQSPGFSMLVIGVWSDPDAVLSGKPVTTTYRQPLVRSKGDGHFFYLPIFDNLPENISTADTNHYAITLAATPECSLTITAGPKKVTVARGQSVTLGAERRQPIQAVVDCPGFSPKIPVDAINDLHRYKTNFDDGEFFQSYSNRLCFFVTRGTPIAGARYVDLPKFPKLGFIKEEPDLIITNLSSVETNFATIETGPSPIIDLKLRPEDGEDVEWFMKRNGGRTVLITYKGKVLDSFEAMATFRPVEELLWGVTNSADLKELMQSLKPLVK